MFSLTVALTDTICDLASVTQKFILNWMRGFAEQRDIFLFQRYGGLNLVFLRTVFHGLSRGSSKVLLGPAILYHFTIYGRPTPGWPNSYPGVGRPQCNLSLWTPHGYHMKYDHGLPWISIRFHLSSWTFFRLWLYSLIYVVTLMMLDFSICKTFFLI
jgi:hypothetical protein